ncbi:hypothetical protein J437_LFUL000373 [Ladona fulva]|uniref:Uncharacterized protein n=1 Tax=Ladona fulva TaxID=123851 RepID=A0A8K0K2Z5_LADFU|nr:hypothetical protein J437_LFUL000373 [Ladona fulva]
MWLGHRKYNEAIKGMSGGNAGSGCVVFVGGEPDDGRCQEAGGGLCGAGIGKRGRFGPGGPPPLLRSRTLPAIVVPGISILQAQIEARYAKGKGKIIGRIWRSPRDIYGCGDFCMRNVFECGGEAMSMRLLADRVELEVLAGHFRCSDDLSGLKIPKNSSYIDKIKFPQNAMINQ